MDTKTRFIQNLFDLGLANQAITYELGLLDHEITQKNLDQLDSFTNRQSLCEFAELMHIRCIVYYGRLKIPRWTSIQILDYIKINKVLELENEKYTTDYIDSQLAKWDEVNALISLTTMREFIVDSSTIQSILTLGYGIQELKSLFSIISTTNTILEKIKRDGFEVSTFIPNCANKFMHLRRHIFYLKKEGFTVERARDLLCEYGYNFLVYTYDLIELHYQWETKTFTSDRERDFLNWVIARQEAD